MQKDKILVTGASGFLGAYIIKELIGKGYSVKAMRHSSSLPFFIEDNILKKAEWVEGDVLDVVLLRDILQDVKCIIHSAAVVSFWRPERKKMYQINVEGTANLVNAALEAGVPRFIHISSVAALGRTRKGGRVDEETPWQSADLNSHYGISKRKAELEVWRGFAEGLNGVILNPSTILGFGDWNKGSCAIFKTVWKQFPFYTEGMNGFVDVEDVARCAAMMIESEITGQRFIVNGDNWPFRKLQNTIAVCFGVRKPGWKAGPFLLSIGWRVEMLKALLTGQRPFLTRESARVGSSKTWFDSGKLLRYFPEFQFTPLEITIEKACKKYLEHLKLKD
ncbi:MAG: NAD-dependent epimerase/dehydratase family protein [Chitinophagaceae bacterium]|nr:NAD-dependent epimerase/dehydratase family protein [Chitinophagaceae bacterium]